MKALVVHGVLAALGLFLAYSAHRASESGSSTDESIALVTCTPQQFQSLRLETEARVVAVARRSDLGRDALWVSTRDEKDGARSEKGFVGNKEAHALVESVTPMSALRSLGTLNEDALKQAGLAPSGGSMPARLVLTCDGSAHVFFLGGSVFGRAERYAKGGEHGAVWLLSSDVTKPLEAPEARLMQRDVTDVPTTDVASVLVEASATRRVFLQRDRLRPAHAEWVDERAPEHRDESYGNWMTKFFRLRAQAYLAPNELPPAPYEAVLRLVLRDAKGRALDELSLVKGPAGADAEAASGAPVYYAKSHTTHGWVALIPSQSEGFVAGWDAIVE